jgi:ADP-ribose pyrophosphatase YjhB (NUDIX family)
MKQLFARLWKKLNLPKSSQLFIMRLFNDEFLVGVTGVIFNKEDKVLLLKHTYRQTEWSLPGGYLKRGEHPQEGVSREILEETGMHVRIKKIIKTSHDPTTARLDISCYGTFVRGKFKPSVEVSEYGFFSYEKLPHIGKRQKKLIERVLVEERGYKINKINWFNYFYKSLKKAKIVNSFASKYKKK